MRILITGSRYFSEGEMIRDAILGAAAGRDPATVTVVHGAAKGADRLSGEIARAHGFMVEEHPANFYPNGVYTPANGPKRNLLMVSLGADICLAFLQKGEPNKGTSHCKGAAAAAGIPVLEHWSTESRPTAAQKNAPVIALPHEMSFVTIDFETANSDKASIIQVGITKVIKGEIVATHTQPVLPDPMHRRFAWANTRIHGLAPGYIYGADRWAPRLEKIVSFSGTLPLIAHNVSVERGCILRASEVAGVAVPDLTLLCSLKLARKKLPDLPKHGLAFLADEFGYTDFQHHDAGEDARITAMAVLEIARRTGTDTIAELFADQATKGGYTPMIKEQK